MLKILVICRAFSNEFTYYRWRKMAQDYKDLEIVLIGPYEYETYDWGNISVQKLQGKKEKKFQIIPLKFIDNKFWRGGFYAVGLSKIIRSIKPNFIYLIGTETSDLTLQVVLIRKLFLPNVKIALFTMIGTDLPKNNPNFYLRWKIIRNSVDAFFCHCPRTLDILRRQGKVWKPIYLQTQVGVPTDIFKPNIGARKKIRDRYNIKESDFLIGSICRITEEKGLFDVINAIPVDAPWKYIIFGSGPDENKIKDKIIRMGLEKKIILAGKIEYPYEVSDALNALDCSILVSKTTQDWQDTFALAVAQAMAVGIPIIVSNSGGLPYQVGNSELIVSEGDISAIHSKLDYLHLNPNKRIEFGHFLYNRLQKSFSVSHLNKCFYFVVQDIIQNHTIYNHKDQVDFIF